MRVHRKLPLVVLLVISSFQLFAQTVIRERVEIEPQKELAEPSRAVMVSPSTIHAVNGSVGQFNVPGAVVSSGTAAVIVPDLPFPNNNVAGLYLELRVDGPGGGTFPLKRYYLCEGVVHETNFPAPEITVTGCAQVYVLYKVISWSGFARCNPRESPYKFAQGEFGGSGESFVIEDTVFNQFSVPIPVSATVSVTVVPSAGSAFTNLGVVPTLEELACTQSTLVNFTALNSDNQPLSFCAGTSYPTTASLEGAGPFAYVRQGMSEGSSVNFAMTTPTSSFEVVLDTSRGIIPLGFQTATLRVNVEGIEQTKNITFRCDYPEPEVTIINPSEDVTIELTSASQPVIVLEEEHLPSSGQFEPTITWEPGNTINTADYYDQIEDSLVLVVTVTARNIAGMESQDTRTITLKKKECDLQVPRYPQGGGSAWANDIYDNTDSTIARLGCALSSMAMVMTAFGDPVTPGELNAWMKDPSRIAEKGGFVGDRVNWDAIVYHSPNSRIRYMPGGGRLVKDKKTRKLNLTAVSDPSILDDPLEQCKLVIVQVYNTQTGNQHWVVVTGKNGDKYTIVDPGRGETFLDAYGAFWGYIIVEKNN